MDKKYHFIGIGGIGMSALARILLDKQVFVSGSDLKSSSNLEQLKNKGAIVQKGHSAKHICKEQTVVFTSGVKRNNPELLAARAMKCPLLHRSQLLAELMKGHLSLMCSGTHGKTTTASLLTALLMENNPSFAIGGMVQGLNGKCGQGSFFVAEADESDGTFLNYYPKGAIVTNVEPEHMDYYQSIESLHQAFKAFIDQIQNHEWFFYCGDDLVLNKLADKRGVAYGFSKNCSLQLTHYRQKGWKIYFDFTFEKKRYENIEVALIGEHNALNAAAVFGLALRLGVEDQEIRLALKTFPGIARRCQKREASLGTLFIDDYAHHPTEIKTTIRSVKQAIQERRLVVLFQPHRYSRTRDTLEEYGKAFEMADQVYITDIYSAGEDPIEEITSQRVVEKIQASSNIPCHYIPREKCDKISLSSHDVFLTLGAGDVTSFHTKMSSPKKLILGVVFGGASCEHEVSLRSARFVSKFLDHNLYEVRYFGIDKKGRWVTGKKAKEILDQQSTVTSTQCCPIFDMVKTLETCDLFLPILHGSYGEDGTIQGFFDMLGKPYVGPDCRAAAVCIDKVLTKRLVSSYGIAVPKDLSFSPFEWNWNKKEILKKIQQTICFPLYVKPVHLGSSIGISYLTHPKKLEEAIEKVFQCDTMVMIEEGKVGCRELEFPVIGNTHTYSMTTFFPGEKLAEGTFVDYAKKYGDNPVPTTIYPELDPVILEKGKALAAKAYQAVGGCGMARIDFLLDQEDEFWFFEMNPIPGLTDLSLFPKVWQREGGMQEELLNRLIILALEKKRQIDRYIHRILN